MSENPASEPSAVAGWYTDPSAAGSLRYWDGAQWTDNPSGGSVPTQGPARLGTIAAANEARGVGRKTLAVASVVGIRLGTFAILPLVLVGGLFLMDRFAAGGDARGDVRSISEAIHTYYESHKGAPPSVYMRDDHYYLKTSGEAIDIGPASDGVTLGGVVGFGQLSWCVWVENTGSGEPAYHDGEPLGPGSGPC